VSFVEQLLRHVDVHPPDGRLLACAEYAIGIRRIGENDHPTRVNDRSEHGDHKSRCLKMIGVEEDSGLLFTRRCSRWRRVNPLRQDEAAFDQLQD
jgi:hypothetical protein